MWNRGRVRERQPGNVTAETRAALEAALAHERKFYAFLRRRLRDQRKWLGKGETGRGTCSKFCSKFVPKGSLRPVALPTSRHDRSGTWVQHLGNA